MYLQENWLPAVHTDCTKAFSAKLYVFMPGGTEHFSCATALIVELTRLCVRDY